MLMHVYYYRSRLLSRETPNITHGILNRSHYTYTRVITKKQTSIKNNGCEQFNGE